MKTKLARSALCILCVAMLANCTQKGGVVENISIGNPKYGDYPITSDTQLTYYSYFYDPLRSEYQSLNETPFAAHLKEATGIDVEFIHPTDVNAGDEFFSLMIASNDLPDIVEANWYDAYNGGAQAAINDNVIYSLNDIIDEASPNLKAYLAENPDISRLLKTDEGHYYVYPFVRGDDILQTYVGPMVRKDLLDQAGLDMPETVAEWDTVIRKFKEMGVKIPLTLTIGDYSAMEAVNDFLGAFNLMYGFYVVDDVVKYGAYEPRFKEYVELIAGWYADDLIDKAAVVNDGKRLTAEAIAGNIGAAFATAGGSFGAWAQAMKTSLPEADFQPTTYPVMNKGDRPFTGQKEFPVNGYGAAISTKCSDIELAARLLDYGYSEEGILTYNFGKEGVSYTMVDGIPTYTAAVIDPEENGNVSISQGMARHIKGNYSGPFVQDRNYLLQFYAMDFQKKAVEIWSQTDAMLHKLPLLSLTEDENVEYARIMKDVNTFKQEEYLKYVTGAKSLDTFDSFYSELRNIGIEKAIALQQAAYDRFMLRK